MLATNIVLGLAFLAMIGIFIWLGREVPGSGPGIKPARIARRDPDEPDAAAERGDDSGR